MKKTAKYLLLCLASCVAPTAERGLHAKAPTTKLQQAQDFMTRAEAELKSVGMQTDRTAWVNETYITEDTEILLAKATEKSMEMNERLITQSRAFDDLDLPPELRRKMTLLRLASSLPAPTDSAKRSELASLASELSGMYGKGKACNIALLTKEGECLDLGQLSHILSTSTDPKKLEAAFNAWHSISIPMRNKYERFVVLSNEGAQHLGFHDTGDMWRSGYDMSPAQFEAEEERLWQQVKPLYQSLHCYVRKQLNHMYGDRVQPKTGPIRADLLGNMWAQEWGDLYERTMPFPKEPSLNVTAGIQKKKLDAQAMVKIGESFFTSLGMPSLPDTFWTRSMFTKPRDRDVVCHASAWDIGMVGDPRVKMCIEPDEENLKTIHHELGHIYYYLHYPNMAALFQQGANDGFHEGIGDTLVLSMTPQYLQSLGLIPKVPFSKESQINALYKRALEKVAFLPFGKLVDMWRWQVFDGRVPASQYNTAWWRLKKEYQGIVPPSERGENFFDPGAKYHVPGNVPYARYFLAHILQFQFHRALCKEAGFEGNLDQCSIFGSEAAGKKMSAMLEMGASQPWPKALEVVTGEKQMDASAIVDYFAPLKAYLDQQNAGESCGW